MALVKAEAVTVALARESTLGTAPTSGWQLVQPNPGGISNWHPQLATVERDPLSKYAAREKGDIVGLDAAPSLTHDLNKEWIDLHAELVWRSVAKHAGNTGVSLFRPTAVTGTAYTVASAGALTAGFIVFARGFATAANNGAKVVTAGSTATSINASGLVAEPSPPANATLEVCGVQGASGDITLNASGNLTCTTLNFTTLGLTVGQWIKIGGATAVTQFATAAYNGYARITAITATQLTLERRSWVVGSADTGASKTIQLFFSRFYRNVPIDNADYREPSLHGELEELGAGTADAATYTYAKGLNVNTFQVSAPLRDKITTTVSYIGTDVADPVLTASRVAGASSALLPLAASLMDTSTDLADVRLSTGSSEATLSAEVNSWNLTINNNVKARNQQGTLGAAGMIYGKHEPSVSMEVYYLTDEIPKAARDNRDCTFRAFVRNGEVGLLFDLPAIKVRGAARSYAANEAVMVSLELPANRDPATNIVSSLSVFAYLP